MQDPDSVAILQKKLLDDNKRIMDKLQMAEEKFQQSQIQSVPLKKNQNSFDSLSKRNGAYAYKSQNKPSQVRSESNPQVKMADIKIRSKENKIQELKDLQQFLPPPKLPKTQQVLTQSNIMLRQSKLGQVGQTVTTIRNVDEDLDEMNIKLHEDIIKSMQQQISKSQDYQDKYKNIMEKLKMAKKDGKITSEVYKWLTQ